MALVRQTVLERLIQIHERFCAGFQAACRKGCAACCTGNVVVTTMEGLVLLETLEQEGPEDWRAWFRKASTPALYRPLMTINQWAEACLRDEDPEAAPDWTANQACPLVIQQMCPVYAVRPLACRAMLSRTTCAPGGAADMPEAVLAFNTVLMQFLEAIDQPGLSGNLIDILCYLTDPGNRQRYLSGRLDSVPPFLLRNQPLPGLMVPPEQVEQLRPVIREIQAVVHRSPGS